VANIKSQIKRNGQNEAAHVRNKAARSSMKTSAKKVRGAVAEGDEQAAAEQFRAAARELDQAASSGVLHKRAAARRKSRLARAVNTTASS
jgi:small subunit ribosomal protein S20